MEVTLNHNNLSCYQLICQRVHCHEETQEAIVPDACPDILRVIQTSGQICLRGKQAKEGTASVTGVVQAVVLYQPEGEGGLRRVPLSIPFDCQIPVAGLDSQGEIVTTTQLKVIEGRILNPRKLLVRVDVAICVAGYMPREYVLCHSATADVDCGIQEAQESRDTYLVMAVEGKPFTFSEQVRLPGQGEIGEILATRALPVCSECRRIGNKLILKGELGLGVLVREPAGGITVSEHQIPFSQIIEIMGGGEAGDCHIDLELVQLDILPSQEGGKQLEVQAEILAQGVVRGHCTVALLKDAYSTSWEMDVETEIHRLPTLLDSTSSTQNLRELLELDGTVRKVVDCWCSLGEVIQWREDSRLQLGVDVYIGMLYIDEGGSLQYSTQVIQGNTAVDCPETTLCQCSCRCPQEVFATPVAGGVEVRVAIQYDYLLLTEEDVTVVATLSPVALRQRGVHSPSVVLRRGAPGESLWDLAKLYGTTCGELIAANGLEEDALLPDGMLLIPSGR